MAAQSCAPALTFQSTTFDVIDRNGQPWLRAHQIGVALDYKRSDIIAKLYRANAAEFTDSMTAVVRLPTAGGMQDVRIFSLRGAHLLGMFARTKVAAEFRRWALDVLDRETAAMPYHVAPNQTLSADALAAAQSEACLTETVACDSLSAPKFIQPQIPPGQRGFCIYATPFQRAECWVAARPQRTCMGVGALRPPSLMGGFLNHTGGRNG